MEDLTCSLSRREFIGVLGALAVPSALIAQDSPETVHLLAIGDWGAPPEMTDPKDVLRLRTLQDRVANAMADYAEKLQAQGTPLSAVLALGDNFYGPLTGPDDSRFKERFEELYSTQSLNVPFYFALGNHDYEDYKAENWKHQIAYARGVAERRLKWGAEGDDTWYRVDFPAEGQQLLTVLVLNTNTDHVSKEDWKRQIDFLKVQLAKSVESRWRIVVAHHPMYTDGYHWDGKKDPDLYPTIRKAILPELGRVAFYVSAHDHNLQHIRHKAYPHLDLFVSGAGGGDFPQQRRRFKSAEYSNEFFENTGFIHLSFTKRRPGRNVLRSMHRDGRPSGTVP